MASKIASKGQLAIFAVVAILLVGAIVLVVIVMKSRQITIFSQGDEEPIAFMSSCMREAYEEVSEILVSQGGVFSPSDYKVYNDTKVTYLCKNINFYEPCINQYPRLITSLQNEMKIQMEKRVDDCLNVLEQNLGNQNYDTHRDPAKIEVLLRPGFAEVIADVNLVLNKDGSSQRFESFKTTAVSPLYNLGVVAQEITAQEAKYCYFEYVGFMLLYPDISIAKFVMSDSTKIYSITHKKTGETMNIAIRGCAIPAGF